MSTLFVVMPAYNEEQNIEDVVKAGMLSCQENQIVPD